MSATYARWRRRSRVRVRHVMTRPDAARGKRNGGAAPLVRDAGDWKSELTVTRKGNNEFFAKTVGNIATILTHDKRWKGVFGYDERAEAVTFRQPPPFRSDYAGDDNRIPREIRDEDDTRIALWLERAWEIDASPNTVNQAVNMVARQQCYDEVRDYLDGLSWDGESRIDTWLRDYLGAEDDELTRAIAAKWLISAVARTYEPGCQADYMLIIEGEQGIRKSSALRALVPRDHWFADHVGPIGTKDAQQALQGLWILEFGELASMTKAESEQMKQFVTAKEDRYRASYGRRTVSHPRRCVFAGTTNDKTYLRDATGNRRYWPVRAMQADVEGIAAARDQLWAEAVARYQAGERWYLDERLERVAQEAQEARRQEDPWESRIRAWLEDRSYPADGGMAEDRTLGEIRHAEGVTPAEVLEHALEIPPGRHGQTEANRVARVMQRLGWARRQKRSRQGRREWRYAPSTDAVTSGTASDEGKW